MWRLFAVLLSLLLLGACGSSAAGHKPHNEHAVVQMGSVPAIGVTEPGMLGDQHVYEFTIPDGKTCVAVWDDNNGVVGLSCDRPPSAASTTTPPPATTRSGLVQVYP